MSRKVTLGRTDPRGKSRRGVAFSRRCGLLAESGSLQRAAERLRQSNIPVLGALLNNLDLQQYGYAFKKSYYDYYEEDGSSKKEPPAQRAG